MTSSELHTWPKQAPLCPLKPLNAEQCQSTRARQPPTMLPRVPPTCECPPTACACVSPVDRTRTCRFPRELLRSTPVPQRSGQAREGKASTSLSCAILSMATHGYERTQPIDQTPTALTAREGVTSRFRHDCLADFTSRCCRVRQNCENLVDQGIIACERGFRRRVVLFLGRLRAYLLLRQRYDTRGLIRSLSETALQPKLFQSANAGQETLNRALSCGVVILPPTRRHTVTAAKP